MSVKKLSLKGWIAKVGLANVAKKLKITPSTVRHWRRGHAIPSDHLKLEIKRLSQGAVSYEEMIEPFYKQKPHAARVSARKKKLLTKRRKTVKK